jgi:hypothetical protein
MKHDRWRRDVPGRALRYWVRISRDRSHLGYHHRQRQKYVIFHDRLLEGRGVGIFCLQCLVLLDWHLGSGAIPMMFNKSAVLDGRPWVCTRQEQHWLDEVHRGFSIFNRKK